MKKKGKVSIFLSNNSIHLHNIKIPFDYFYNLIAYKDTQDYKDILKRVNYIKDNLYPMIQQNGCGIKQKEQTLYQWNFKNDKIRVYMNNKVPKFEILYSKFFEKYNERSCYLYETYECMNHQAIIELIESQEFYQKQKR